MKQTHRTTDSRLVPPRLNTLSLALLLCMVGVAVQAEAADKKASREREALRRTQQQLSQVQGQVGTLEQEKVRLAEELDKAQKSSQAMESESARLQREIKAGKGQQTSLSKELTLTKEALDTATQRLTEMQTTLSESGKKLAETARILQQTEAEKRNLEGIKLRNERDITSCERNNLALYQIGRSLMDRFERKTCGETLAQGEPFSGLKRVETENLMEKYRDKLEDQKWIKPPGD